MSDSWALWNAHAEACVVCSAPVGLCRTGKALLAQAKGPGEGSNDTETAEPVEVSNAATDGEGQPRAFRCFAVQEPILTPGVAPVTVNVEITLVGHVGPVTEAMLPAIMRAVCSAGRAAGCHLVPPEGP